MVFDFCSFFVLAWLSKDDIEKAEPYYQLLLHTGNQSKNAEKAFMEMVAKKRKAILEKSN
jgi:hypothetical protein